MSTVVLVREGQGLCSFELLCILSATILPSVTVGGQPDGGMWAIVGSCREL